ncbi:sensor histidine kinase [Glycomyces albidus]|uniref:histidine kinase n=1 Tax=Glycomyces albidus TaxID=2656774 RepID=A0A6L5G3F6_9ACTN|nr:ATP-binding protein [Glycomyces albidus]MQM24101.1 two-component sensor histidine kinase [Glycomyces albidus]
MREGPHWRVRAAVVAATGVAAAGLGMTPFFSAWMTVPAATAVAGALAVMVAGPRAHGATVCVTGAVAVVSLTATAGMILMDATYAEHARAATVWAVAESSALLALIAVTVRVAPRSTGSAAAAAAAGLAVPAWLLRFTSGPWEPEMLAGLAVWALAGALGATVGLYLRALDERRIRAVAEARSVQRLQLARDLHDFVAHDISAMLAQAHAGQILIERDTAAAADAFRSIADSGERAMASMDRAVHALHDAEVGDLRSLVPALTDLPGLAARFSAAGAAQVRLDLDPDLEALPGEITGLAYRIVVEALTNVRRHANRAQRVDVAVHRTASGIAITVADDGPGPRSAPAPRRSGLGLAGLTARARTLGGSLAAGPAEPTGWQVTAFLPVSTHRPEHHG